ncbi:unnamed protein product, partial [Coregonus sp. 'balchen']
SEALEPDEPLCCCEFVDRQGGRSHVTACYCDCEDLGDACDRWLKKEPQKADSLSRLVTMVTDHLRVPWFWGGARRVHLSVLPPLLLLPVLLHITALHFLLGMVVLSALLVLPGPVLPGLHVVPLPHRGLLQGGCTAAHVRPHTADVHSTVTYHSSPPDRDPAHTGLNGVGQEVLFADRGSGSEQQDQGVEQRESGRSRNWCSVCRVVRPPRAGHCRICAICVLRLDHHCVWWDPLKHLSLWKGGSSL